MKSSAVYVSLFLFFTTGAQARHELPSRYAEQRRGNQFVTGPCNVDSDCQQGCCGFSTGKCAGPAIAQANGSGGCGHGSAKPNCNVATLLGLGSQCIAGAVNGDLSDPAIVTAAKFTAKLDGIAFDPATSESSSSSSSGSASSSNAPASSSSSQQSKLTVFSACSADSDCQQGCCGFSTGKCAGPAVAQTNGSGGCGHGNAKPNCDVATLLGFQSQCIAGAQNGNLQDPTTQAAAAFAAQLDGLSFTPSGSSSSSSTSSSSSSSDKASSSSKSSSSSTKSISSLAASQQSKLTVFSACSADSDCQQGCCGFSTGKCAGPAVAQTNGSGGCGHGNAKPNCDVATLLGFQSQCVAGAANGNLKDQTTQAAAAFAAQLDGLKFTPA